MYYLIPMSNKSVKLLPIAFGVLLDDLVDIKKDMYNVFHCLSRWFLAIFLVRNITNLSNCRRVKKYIVK